MANNVLESMVAKGNIALNLFALNIFNSYNFRVIEKKKTKTVHIDTVKIGSGNPVVIQSMTKVPTVDLPRCLNQIKQLVNNGCHLVRIAVPRKADTAAFAQIVKKTNIPLIADVHFSPERAIEAIEAGAAKIRLNPGNIKKRKDILRIIDAAKMHKTAIRIGINEASIVNYRKQNIPIGKRNALILNEMRRYIRIFEDHSFSQIILSAKSSDPLRTIQINRSISQVFDYPIHLGLTHAGLPEDALVPSSISLGTLLAEGIGDTIRVSTAGNPVEEVRIAKRILTALGLYGRCEPELIVCPTCGRAEIDVIKLAKQVKKAIRHIKKPLRVAVMGCVVNGPGEASDADIALCAARNKAYIYKNGRRVSIVPEAEAVSALLKLLENM